MYKGTGNIEIHRQGRYMKLGTHNQDVIQAFFLQASVLTHLILT